MTEEKRGLLTVDWSYDDEDRMKVENQLNVIGGLTTNTYSGDGLRRSTNIGKDEGDSALTTFIWDGSDYLMEKS